MTILNTYERDSVKWRKERKRRDTMAGLIFGGLIALAVLIVLCISLWRANKKFNNDIQEDDGITMVDLSDVGSRHDEDTIPIKEWAEMTEQEKYEHDISESMPEVAEKLEYRKYEDVKYRYLEIGLSKELQHFCQDICDDYGLEYAFLLAIMETESTFREDIGNERILGGEEGGERYYGYMQLSMANCIKAKDYALDAHTPEGNIEMGVVILADLMDAYDNDILMVTMAYKGGEGAAKSWREQGYVLPIAYTVMDNYEKYKELLK